MSSHENSATGVWFILLFMLFSEINMNTCTCFDITRSLFNIMKL